MVRATGFHATISGTWDPNVTCSVDDAIDEAERVRRAARVAEIALAYENGYNDAIRENYAPASRRDVAIGLALLGVGLLLPFLAGVSLTLLFLGK